MITVNMVMYILSFARTLLKKITVSRDKKLQENEELMEMLKADSIKHQREIDRANKTAEKLKESLL